MNTTDILILYLAKYDGVARLPKPHLDCLVGLQYAVRNKVVGPAGETIYIYRITGHGIAFLDIVLERFPKFVLKDCFPIDLEKIKLQQVSDNKRH